MKKIVFKIYLKLFHYKELLRTAFLKFHIIALYHVQTEIGKKIYFGSGFSIKIEYEKALLEIGDNTCFKEYCSITIADNGKIEIGKNVFFNSGCSVSCLDNVCIGDNSIFGQGVKIYDHNHNYRNKEKRIVDQGYTTGAVVIEENCWIGANVVILKGVTIGRHSVIGANCIIHTNVESYSLVISDSKNQIVKKI